MLTHEAKRRIAAAGMFALPVVLVAATETFFGGPSPVKAEASVIQAATPAPPVSPPPVGAPPVEAPVSEAERAAGAYAASLRDEPYGPTPFFYPHRGRPAVVPPPGEREQDDAPTFTVSAIIAGASGNAALVKGTWYHVNDELGGTGWRIIAIDAAARSVTIRDPATDRLRTSHMRAPGE